MASTPCLLTWDQSGLGDHTAESAYNTTYTNTHTHTGIYWGETAAGVTHTSL